ncbi:MAG: HesA/MoeB/ThiF family protein [Alphaproteobacteria bacterium]|nr:HesA/MoeB/ThiF family protein [Alphaproteobacteria bacterium]TAD87446.1 MAG: HesA/MoeB/ThiF family protein [Alphaproteobacteria bacterium]
MSLSEAEIQRYSRQILLREVGGIGQERLKAARVLVVGMGGLGSPAALYLAAAGVGTLVLADGDQVEASNLNRQILHSTADIGRAKVDSAADRLGALNPETQLLRLPHRLTDETLWQAVERVDLVVNGVDNFATTFALVDACHRLGRPLVHAALYQDYGELFVQQSHRGAPHPCYRCLHPAPPPPDLAPTCATAGILGAVAGVMGALQAVEAVKLLVGSPAALAEAVVIHDAWTLEHRRLGLKRRAGCRLCGSP